MDLDEARQFLAANHRCVLITRKHDGSPQPSPVVHALDAAGHVVVSTRSRSVKVRNLQRDPRVTLCVLPDTFFGKWIVVDGSARIEQTIYVERDGQRGILLGKGGETLKWIGKASREELAVLLDRPVHLFLHVKVKSGWAEDRTFFHDMGLDFDV